MENLASILLAVGGGLLLLLGLFDAVMTTTAISEFPGPLTRVLGLTVWRGLRKVTSRAESNLLRAAGSLVALSVVSAWLLALWFGWTLVFASVSDSVVNADTGESATFAAKVYYVAATMATTGVGDYIPTNDVWRVVAGLASVSGLALITLLITYLVPVISAAVDRVRTAEYLSSLGGTPIQLLLRNWDGHSFDPLVDKIPQLTQRVVSLRAELLAYPVLHFFHGADPERALAPRIAALDEALSILEFGVEDEVKVPKHRLLPLREALDSLLVTVVNQTFAQPRDDVPDTPDLQELRDAGIPTKDQQRFEADIRAIGSRRAKLYSYVRDDSWRWENVLDHATPSPSDL